jgi:hypothetical protein
MDVTINDTEISVPADLSTWGDLLDWIESDYLKAGQCITHVYLGGTETYNYRDRMLCEQELETVGAVSVSSGDFDRVVHESLAELERELNSALGSTQDIVRQFENRKEDDAYNQLAQLLESIRIFFTIFSRRSGMVRTYRRRNFTQGVFDCSRARSHSVNQRARAPKLDFRLPTSSNTKSRQCWNPWQKIVARTREHLN